MDEAGYLAYPDPAACFDQGLPEQPVVTAPVARDQEPAANRRCQQRLIAAAFAVGQSLPGVTGPCQEVGEGRQPRSVVGVEGHREVRRTEKTTWHAAGKLQLCNEVGVAAEGGA